MAAAVVAATTIGIVSCEAGGVTLTEKERLWRIVEEEYELDELTDSQIYSFGSGFGVACVPDISFEAGRKYKENWSADNFSYYIYGYELGLGELSQYCSDYVEEK